ncbi:MAG: 30S ribosomal protein S4 [bacterium]|nr:30S ribosomal protein S4 [bacterium]
MRNTGPKTRLARRIGEPLRDKDVKFLVKRNYPPGMHGQRRSRKSEYGIQLSEKQKAKWTYDVSEKQFRNYVEAATRERGVTGLALLELLELRLDNVVYRLGFAPSRAAARQLVSHGFVTVNGKKVNVPSYHVKIGDEIGINKNKQASKYIQRLMLTLKEHKPQDWVSLQAQALLGKVLSAPTRENTGSTVQMELIIEHYSR